MLDRLHDTCRKGRSHGLPESRLTTDQVQDLPREQHEDRDQDPT